MRFDNLKDYILMTMRALPGSFATSALVLLSASLNAHPHELKSSATPEQNDNITVVRFDSGDKALKIPLEIDNKIILVRMQVNNSKPLKFIFDTGASITFLSSKRVADLGLKSSGEASGEATGGRITASIIRGVSLKVPGAEVSNQPVAAMDIPTTPGFEFDGVIGYHFINQFVVEIDYQTKTMNLYSPRTYRYSGKGETVPLSFAGGRKTPLVITNLIVEGRAPVAANVELDTGFDGTLLVNSPAVKKHNLLAAMPEAVRSTARGAGGEQQRVVGPIKAIQLGHFTFDKPPVVLSLDTKGGGALEENDGALGGELLRRFKLIIDYSRQRMILEPNSSFKEPYDLGEGE
jgi:hypothetical protein